jgi:hypothetical protein
MILKLPKIQELKLSHCVLSDAYLLSLSASLLNFSNSLAILDLSYNNFSSLKIFEWVFNATSNLTELDLSYNIFNGTIAYNSCNIRNPLKRLDLSDNELQGGTILESFGDIWFLSDNLLYGSILKKFPHELVTLYLDSNNLTGVISDSHFDNMSMLIHLNLSYNSLALNFSENWAPPFQLYTIYLRTCIIGPSFPKWLQSQKYLNLLDISDTGISDSVPVWFWTLAANMMLMNISYNNLIGTIPNLPIRFSPPKFEWVSDEYS